MPIAAAAVYALLYSVGMTGLLAKGFTFDHWLAVFNKGELLSATLTSVAVALAVVVLAAGAGLTLALTLGASIDDGPVGLAAHVPLAVPGTVAALLVFLLFTASGFFPRLLLAVGVLGSLDNAPSLVHDPYYLGVITAHAFSAVPFLALVFRGLYRSERIAVLSQVAASLGATQRQTLWRITIPALLRRSESTLVLVFVLVLGSYEIPLLLGRQSPEMFSVLVMRKYGRFDLTEKPEALAIAFAYTLLVAGLLALFFRFRERR
ncbi:MAG: ABC transporter permease subunit [Myxococcota bacterium]